MGKKVEITSLSSRGQIVIPLEIRERLQLDEGEKFIVIGERDTIILRKVKMPSFNDVNKLIRGKI